MNIRSRTFHSTLAAALLLSASGCDRGLTDVNRNPNSPEEATPEFLFANATEAAVSRVFGSGLHMDITALWVQHYAEHRFSTEDRYILSDAAVSGHWSGFYAGPIQDFEEVVELSMEEGRTNAAAQGQIMQSWTFQVVTDLWGDIGYSDALLGREASAGNTPKFDPQQEVYNALLAELEAAQGAIVPGSPGILPRADLIYAGNLDRWKKFANSLRLRTAMRLSDADAARAKAEFVDALAAGVFTSNADNAVFQYVDNGTNVHPIFAYERTRDDHSVSATLIDTLKSFADPRLSIYAKPNAAGAYQGARNGSTASPALTSISKIGEFFSRANAPAYLMTYAEVLFLMAEAAERGWIAGDAAALYRDAIRASMQQFGVSAAAINAYLAQPRVEYQGGQVGLQQIWFQKWLALYGNSVEAYAEWRRTGYPRLAPGPNAQNNGKIPVRLPYPERERSLNGANLQAAVERQGGTGLMSLNDRVWWDQF